MLHRNYEYSKKWLAEHKGKYRNYSEKWRKENPEKWNIARLTYHLKKKYKLTYEWYTQQREKQKHCCLICHYAFTQKTACVDHDHHTGIIRGLLCRQCNTLIGQANDNIDILKRAIKYLQKQ